MDNKISSFIEGQKNLTFCTSTNNNPYCASCFYAFMNENNYLVFMSDKDTRHIAAALINDKVAGTIIPDIGKRGTIKGIQFTGKFIIPRGELLEKSKKIYHKKYPFAIPLPGEFWAVELFSIKMTDNTLGFGKKLFWERAV